MSQEKQHTSVAYSLWKWKQFMHEIHVSIHVVTGHYIAYWLERVYDHLSDPGFLKPLKVIFDGLNVSVYLLFPLRRQRLSKIVEDQRFSISPAVMTFFLHTSFGNGHLICPWWCLRKSNLSAVVSRYSLEVRTQCRYPTLSTFYLLAAFCLKVSL